MSDFAAAVKLTRAECLTYNCATATDLSHVRSLLFAPGSDERKLVKALASDADAVVADLEDAVAPNEKEAARALVRDVFAAAGDAAPLRLVRVNGVGTPSTPTTWQRSRRSRPTRSSCRKRAPDAVDALGSAGRPSSPSSRRRRESGSPTRSRRGRAWSRSRSARSTSARRSGSSRDADGLELVYVRSKIVLDSVAAGSALAVRRRPPRRRGRRRRSRRSACSRARSAFAARRASTRHRCRS